MSAVTGVPAAGHRQARHSLELSVGGMTCASCAARIEKKLNRLDGVSATVNFATETARVSFPATMTPGDLIAVVRRAGYMAVVPGGPQDSPARTADPAAPAGPVEGELNTDMPGTDASADAADLRRLRQRLLVSVALAAPVVALAMVPALQFRNWQWVSLALASPVAIWGAWPFHRAAVTGARHGAATMDSLISVGVAGTRQRNGCELPGGRCRGYRAGPGRALPGGACEASLPRGSAGTALTRREGRLAAARWHRGAGAGRADHRRPAFRGQARGEDRHRRGRRRRQFSGRHLHAHRRAGSCRGHHR